MLKENLKKKILFISHDATRTGAPIALINLAKAVNNNYEIEFLLKEGGELYESFSTLATTTVATRQHKVSKLSKILIKVSNKIQKRNKNDKRFDIENLNWKSYDLIISNTITNGDLLPEIRKYYTGKIISYIHELEIATRFFTNEKDLRQLIECTDAFFVQSQVVKSHLVDNLGISPNVIHYLSYYIPLDENLPPKVHNDNFLVGSMGTVDWRKSPDIFIIIAVTLFIKRPNANIKFLWQGAPFNFVETDRLKYDCEKAGLSDRITFIEPSSSLKEFYSSINLFLLTSREDPYPLVVLHAADAEVPTICFDKAGGSPEFVRTSKGGQVISYLDINAAADAILLYYDNKTLLEIAGKNAKAEVVATHQNKDYINKQLEQALQAVLNIL